MFNFSPYFTFIKADTVFESFFYLREASNGYVTLTAGSLVFDIENKTGDSTALIYSGSYGSPSENFVVGNFSSNNHRLQYYAQNSGTNAPIQQCNSSGMRYYWMAI